MNITLRCPCGWSRGLVVNELTQGHAAMDKFIKDHTDLHAQHEGRICKRCHEAPLADGSERSCEFCLDRDSELRMEWEDMMAEQDRASELDDAEDMNEMRCRDES